MERQFAPLANVCSRIICIVMNRKERRAAHKHSKGAHSNGAARATDQPAPRPELQSLFVQARSQHAAGQFSEAAKLYRLILSLDPGHIDALVNLGIALKDDGALSGAQDYKTLFVRRMRGLRRVPRVNGLHELFALALAQSWTRPIALTAAGLSLVMQDEIIAQGVARANEAWPERIAAAELLTPARLAALAANDVLRLLLETAPIPDLAMEHFLASARAAALDLALVAADAGASDLNALAAICALARQCYLNEYVYFSDDNELAGLARLRERLESALEIGGDIPPIWVAAVASYLPLHALRNAAALIDRPWPHFLRALLTQQIREPLEERQMRASIPALTAIDDAVSLKVQRQYEENPYPRWVTTAMTGRAVTLDQYLRGLFPHSAFRSTGKTNADWLIAGCGTGLLPIEIAQNILGARILAVDLSMASLCYAQRMTRLLGIAGIEYAQADIVRLPAVGRMFDAIDASGVLHHLADPFAGWRLLLPSLRTRGVMRLGFYSAASRQDVVAARAFIAKHGYGQGDDEIRRFRQDLMRSFDKRLLQQITASQDFFSISECRDLLFHVEEHRTTLPAIRDFIAENDLEFLGFDVNADTLRQYAARYPDDKAGTDLNRWHKFEARNPLAFFGMYQFWVQVKH